MAGTAVTAQDYPEEYLGLPGDNLNLYAVMKLFQESETLEGFERSLNEENSKINNLDLNGDNLVDYIMVNDYVKDNVHTIVMRVALSKQESQDVAVFTVEQFKDGSVEIQLIGDEELYGKNYIIEPYYANNSETPNPGYMGRGEVRDNATVVRTTTYEVAAWPVVRYIYHPHYVVWHSSWYWDYYPTYWHPWRPWYYHYYYGYHSHWYHDHYYRYYHHWHQPRHIHYNNYYYTSVRSHSAEVGRRVRDGQYRSTYSRPETRREGEALYTSVTGNPARSGRESIPANSQGRRVASDNDRGQYTTGTAPANGRRAASSTDNSTRTNASTGSNGQATRRTPGTVGTQTRTSTSTGTSNTPARRASTTVSERGGSQSEGRSTSTTQRSTTVTTQRSSSSQSAGRSSSTSTRSTTVETSRSSQGTSSARTSSGSGRSTTSASQRSESRPAQARSSEPARASSRQSAPAASSSRQSRSEGSSRSSSKSSDRDVSSSRSSSGRR